MHTVLDLDLPGIHVRHAAMLSGTDHVVLAVHGGMSFHSCLQLTVECDLKGSMPSLKLRVSHLLS